MAEGKRLTQFQNEGLTFEVIDEGPRGGETIILLHGFPERAVSWRGVIPALTEAGYRVLAPNQRGYSPGARPKGVRNYTLPRLAGDVVALADQAGVDTFHVVGHDWGAAVVWELTGKYADRLRTVTSLSVPHPRAFIAAMPRGQVFKSWYMGFFQIPWLPEWLVRKAASRPEVFQKFGGFSDEQARDIIGLLQQPGAATAIINWYRAMGFSNPRSLPGRVTKPTLFVWSDGDRFVGRASAELNERHIAAQYRYEVFPGVSHWIVVERPKETAELVLGHVAGSAA